MSSRYQYTTMDRIFSKFSRDIGSDFDEDDIVEWTGEALEAIGSVKSYEEEVVFSEVKNHQSDIPKWSHAIIQIAKDNHSYNPLQGTILTSTVKEALPTGDINLVGQTVNLTVDYNVWINSSFYTSRFSPVRLKTHSFFNSLVCPENPVVYASCRDEYTIVGGNKLRFSFKEGIVAVAHLRQAVDPETGWPLIPDTKSHTTAIVEYITMMIFKRQFYAGREGAQGKFLKAEQDWQWYCKQAGNVDLMPFGLDEHQNLLDQRSYLLPRGNYYGFFGNLAKAETRPYNNPNGRNH